MLCDFVAIPTSVAATDRASMSCSSAESTCGILIGRYCLLQSRYDYVVVGGGTAGAVVAARLSEDGRRSVALLEAGPSDVDRQEVLQLDRWQELFGGGFDFRYPGVIEPDSVIPMRIISGRVLGGSSSINGAVVFKTPTADLVAWEQLGARGWGVEGTRRHLNSVMKRIHSVGARSRNACVAAFVQAAQESGLPLIDFNRAEVREGVGWLRFGELDGVRQSSSVVYLHSLAARPNLDIITDSPVTRIGFDGVNATRVETAVGAIAADREIVVACGAIETPRLLLLSGLGPAKHLEEIGIPVVADIPGVGTRLIDHPELGVIYAASQPVVTDGVPACQAVLFARSSPSLTAPDLEFHFFAFSGTFYGLPPDLQPVDQGFALMPSLNWTKSEGTVRLRSSDPKDPPEIKLRLLTDPEGADESAMVIGIQIARRIAEQPALRKWIGTEVSPGSEVRTDSDLRSFVRRVTTTSLHLAGSCRMGPASDALAVVDHNLEVRSVRRLRIADASIFPRHVGVNPYVTCMMVGEKCAELIATESTSVHKPGRSARPLSLG